MKDVRCVSVVNHGSQLNVATPRARPAAASCSAKRASIARVAVGAARAVEDDGGVLHATSADGSTTPLTSAGFCAYRDARSSLGRNVDGAAGAKERLAVEAGIGSGSPALALAAAGAPTAAAAAAASEREPTADLDRRRGHENAQHGAAGKPADTPGTCDLMRGSPTSTTYGRLVFAIEQRRHAEDGDALQLEADEEALPARAHAAGAARERHEDAAVK